MLNGLKLINCLPCPELEELLHARAKGQVFILRTCQRTLMLGFNRQPERILEGLSESASQEKQSEAIKTEIYSGLKAYEFLLQTICGLKSRILGENEIVHQFKEAYGAFLMTEKPNRLIQTVLEKLFKDAKDIRSMHLKNIGLQTYAGISRKILSEKTNIGARVVVLGSGQLSEDFIKISRRRFTIILCARNSERVAELQKTYGIEVLPWERRDEIYGERFILNTIGTDQSFIKPMINPTPFECFVDLGEPTPFTWLKGQKSYYSLEEVFKIGQEHSAQKSEKVEQALSAIEEATEHRNGHFTINIPFGWDELLFA